MMTFPPFQGFALTHHALQEMTRRGISREQVEQVLENPEQVVPVQPGRVVCQSRIFLAESQKEYLLRVFVDVEEKPPRVVTVYRTSKVEKYWRQT